MGLIKARVRRQGPSPVEEPRTPSRPTRPARRPDDFFNSLLGLPRGVWGVLSLAWVGVLWWASDVPAGSGLTRVVPGPSGNLLHIACCAALAVLLLRTLVPAPALDAPAAWPGIGSAAGIAVLALVIAWGLLDEIHQFHVPGRMCSLYDVVLDAGGALVVLLWPVPGAPGRPDTRWPALCVLGASVAVGLLAWTGRPWPDALIEELLGRLP